jgi:large subunit ribosomal protein L4
VLDASGFGSPSTKQAAEALAKWGAGRPTLIVLEAEETAALKSFRNIERVQVSEVSAIGVADVIGAASIVISQEALAKLQERLG